MKKIMLFVYLLLIIPIGVSAMEYSDVFTVGDSVEVELYSGDRTKFHVLKDSPAGNQFVTLIMDGTVGETERNPLNDKSAPTVYDDMFDNGDGTIHEPTTLYDKSLIKTKLERIVNDPSEKWRVEYEGLLRTDDLNSLGIVKNASGKYEIPAKYKFLAPIKISSMDSKFYNYWTSIVDGDEVLSVEYNDARTDENGIYAVFEPKPIKDTLRAIRPVVIIDKKYILCNNTKPSKNVKTGVEDYFLPLVAICIVAGGSVILLKKKEVFQSI